VYVAQDFAHIRAEADDVLAQVEREQFGLADAEPFRLLTGA
jgi:hypothetical protein